MLSPGPAGGAENACDGAEELVDGSEGTSVGTGADIALGSTYSED